MRRRSISRSSLLSEAAFLARTPGRRPTSSRAPALRSLRAAVHQRHDRGVEGRAVPVGPALRTGVGFIPLEDFGDRDAWYMPYPMHHVTGKTPFYTMVLVNGRIVIRDGFDTAAFWADIDRYRCTVHRAHRPDAVVPLPAGTSRADDATHALENVFMVPARPVRRRLQGAVRRPGRTSYGSVENSVPIKVPGWGATLGERTRAAARSARATRATRSGIVDEHDNEVPVGEVGELHRAHAPSRGR